MTTTEATRPDEPVSTKPFSCGAQHADWRLRNCERCAKSSYETVDAKGYMDYAYHCDLDRAIYECAGGVRMTARQLERMGYYAAEGYYGWDCPERETTNDGA